MSGRDEATGAGAGTRGLHATGGVESTALPATSGVSSARDVLTVLERLRDLAEAECEALDGRSFSALASIAAERSELMAILACNEGRVRALVQERPAVAAALLHQTLGLDRRSLSLAAECLGELEQEKHQIELLRSWLRAERQARRSSAVRGQYFDGRC